MNLRQASELFRQYRAEGDYASASTVMLDWAREAGKPHNLWHANMVLLLFAFDLGLHEEALLRAAELEKIDAGDPHLLVMTARIYEAQGRHSEAITCAEQAVESAEVEDPLNRENYAEYLRQLIRGRDEETPHRLLPSLAGGADDLLGASPR